jgi:hypothetical protein
MAMMPSSDMNISTRTAPLGPSPASSQRPTKPPNTARIDSTMPYISISSAPHFITPMA